ncbi:MAG: TonB-dependent receptor [bacterium]|nr:TonB-dependent receptor [bacterium]
MRRIARNVFALVVTSLLVFPLARAAFAAADDPIPPVRPATAESEEADQAELSPIVVSADALEGPDEHVVESATALQAAPSSAELLRGTPGANVNTNGSITRQVHYRGMFGTRMNVRVDDMHITSGGPNWMDPPLHYLPRPQLDSLVVDRGIASVSSGAESFGGTVRGRSKTSEFTESSEFEFHGDLETGVSSVDNGYFGGGLLSLANDRHRMHLIGTRQSGHDSDFGSGRIRFSEYERDQYGIGYAARLGDHELGFDYRHNDTDPSGTPALPMDIMEVNTEIARIHYGGTLGETDLRGSIYFNDVDHLMNNFDLRTAPGNPAMFRENHAESSAGAIDLAATFLAGDGTMTLGFDAQQARHDAMVTNPNNRVFFVEAFNSAERDHYSAFFEWRAPLGDRFEVETGLRYTRVEMDSGKVDALPAQLLMMPAMLRNRFNAADRSRSDDNLDGVLKLLYHVTPELRIELAAAHKTRSPNYLERYLWIPSQATAGLADGNNYLGDIGLDPEESWDAELGVDWRTERFYFSPRGFYRRVNDYIQGIPSTDMAVIMVSTANGDPTPLQFANVDAEFFGADASFGGRLFGNVHLDGVVSYVRAKRRDISDDLFRISPLNGALALSYRTDRFDASIGTVAAAKQRKVSTTNGETQTGSWAILNVSTTYRFASGTEISGGVENVLDKTYTDHLAGLNRIANGDVALGARLPGQGRNFFLRIAQRW